MGRENSAAGSVRCALPQRGMEVDGLLATYEYPIPHYYIINFFTVKAATREQLESNEKTNKKPDTTLQVAAPTCFSGAFSLQILNLYYISRAYLPLKYHRTPRKRVRRKPDWRGNGRAWPTFTPRSAAMLRAPLLEVLWSIN